jgi:cytochrome c oxidase subunit 2
MPPDAVAGLEVFNRLGCAVCHSFDSKPLAGPSLQNIYAKEVKLLDGTTMMRNDAYLRDSILESGKHVVYGFRPTMINYGSMLQDGELDQLLALIRFHGQ